MDLIAAHQQGLLEQLELECQDLAGRPGSFVQRAIVLHHLYDHSGGQHGWTLLEAQRQLQTAGMLVAARRRISRWWRTKSTRERMAEGLDAIEAAAGKQARLRTYAACRAYRMTATPALHAKAKRRLPAMLMDALMACHSARRLGDPLNAKARAALVIESEALANAVPGEKAVSLSEVARSSGWRRLHRRLFEQSKSGVAENWVSIEWPIVERAIIADRRMPNAFRANPAQHFYAMLHDLARQRKRNWIENRDEKALAA